MGVQWQIDFDYEEFEKQLFHASLKAFTSVQEDRIDETFYRFSYFTTPLFDRISLHTNTEEELAQKVEHFQKIGQEKNLPPLETSLDELKLMERYGTWYPLKEKYAELCNDINDMLDKRKSDIHELHLHNESYLGFDGAVEIEFYLDMKIESILLKAMTDLDTLKIFEKTNKRENILLSIFGIESRDEEIRSASMLNPPMVYTNFINDLKLAYKISSQLYGHD